MLADGSDLTDLINNQAPDGGPQGWSPDGTRIAFTSARDGNFEIYVIDADGTNAKRLTKNPARDRWPDWSSAGTKIAFMFNRDGNDDMYIMNADGSSQTNLTEAGRGSEPQPFRGDDFETGDLSKCVSVTMA